MHQDDEQSRPEPVNTVAAYACIRIIITVAVLLLALAFIGYLSFSG